MKGRKGKIREQKILKKKAKMTMKEERNIHSQSNKGNYFLFVSSQGFLPFYSLWSVVVPLLVVSAAEIPPIPLAGLRLLTTKIKKKQNIHHKNKKLAQKKTQMLTCRICK